MKISVSQEKSYINLTGVEGLHGGVPTLPGSLGGGIHLWLRPPDGSRGRADPAAAAVRNTRSQSDLAAALARYGAGERRLLRGPHGKPFLPGGPEFNLSHSAGATAVAVADGPVGVDIESRGRAVDHAGIAGKFFLPAESALVGSAPDPALLFLRHWVCKEALCKLAGDGIYRGLRDARAGLDGTAPAYRGRAAWIWEFGEDLGLVGAVAAWSPAVVKVFVIS
jgi:phosphopantetheinyl transferase